MEAAISFEDALLKAKKWNPRYNVCIEHPNAWVFDYDDGKEHIGGPDAGVVILKEDGRMLRLYEYYMTDIGESDVISERKI